MHYKRDHCRICGNMQLTQFLSLGPTPLANAFLKTTEEFDSEVTFPLDVYFCESCSLVQLLDVINPEILFRNYIYVTGTSETIAAHNLQYAETVVNLLDLKPENLVVEVASNDGSLLKCFNSHSVRTLGVEPARNIAAIANARGIETLDCFFNSQSAETIRNTYGSASVVIANNVLAHVDEPKDFLFGCKSILAKDGLVIIEVPYLRELLDKLEYDTIYHEHLCYFSVSALKQLCDAVGLTLIRIDRVPVHGGSIRMYAGLPEYYPKSSQQVAEIIEEEKNLGLNTFSRYQAFARAVVNNRHKLLDLLESIIDNDKSVAGYGAPAKGNTLLNYCGIGTYILPYTVDKNPLKIGRFTPGMHIPVLPVDTLLQRQPDYVLILAWNFAAEIMQQQHGYRKNGGRFIIPIPEAEVI